MFFHFPMILLLDYNQCPLKGQKQSWTPRGRPTQHTPARWRRGSCHRLDHGCWAQSKHDNQRGQHVIAFTSPTPAAQNQSFQPVLWGPAVTAMWWCHPPATERPRLLFGQAWTRALGDLCVHGINLNEIRHNVINDWLGKVVTKHLERRRKTGSN